MSRKILLFLSSLLTAFVVLVPFSSSAIAGDFIVLNCALGNTNSTNNFFIQNSNNGHTSVINDCNTFPSNSWPAFANGGAPASVEFSVKSKGNNLAPSGSVSSATWIAPEGISFKSASGYFRASRATTNGWRLQILFVDEKGKITVDKNMCTDSNCTNQNKIYLDRWLKKDTSAPGGFQRYQIRLTCIRTAGCLKSALASVRANSFSFLVSDTVKPVVFADTAKNNILNNLLQGAWIRGDTVPTQLKVLSYDIGSGVLGYNSFINKELNSAQFLCDPKVQKNNSFPGVNLFPSVSPCLGLFSFEVPLAKLRFLNGIVPLRICSTDISGNNQCLEYNLKIDSEKPQAQTLPNPEAVNNSINLKTIASDSGSGVDRVEYRLGEYTDLDSVPAIVTSQPVCSDNTDPYECKADLQKYNKKRIAIFVKTIDKLGHEAGEMLFGPNNKGIVVDQDLEIAEEPTPVLSLNLHPRRITNKTLARFRFGSNLKQAIYECSVDNKEFSICSSPLSFQATNGRRTFSVRATNPSNGKTSETVVYNWTVDILNKQCKLKSFSGAKLRLQGISKQKGKNRKGVQARISFRYQAWNSGKARAIIQRGNKTIFTTGLRFLKSNKTRTAQSVGRIKSKKQTRLLRVLRQKKQLRLRIVPRSTPGYCFQALKSKKLR